MILRHKLKLLNNAASTENGQNKQIKSTYLKKEAQCGKVLHSFCG
jgi:hypothetical protein